jgi:hypothetical protein
VATFFESCDAWFGPNEGLVTASIDFQDGERRLGEAETERLQREIRSRYPQVRHLFTEVQSAAALAANAARIDAQTVGGQ